MVWRQGKDKGDENKVEARFTIIYTGDKFVTNEMKD